MTAIPVLGRDRERKQPFQLSFHDHSFPTSSVPPNWSPQKAAQDSPQLLNQFPGTFSIAGSCCSNSAQLPCSAPTERPNPDSAQPALTAWLTLLSWGQSRQGVRQVEPPSRAGGRAVRLSFATQKGSLERWLGFLSPSLPLKSHNTVPDVEGTSLSFSQRALTLQDLEAARQSAKGSPGDFLPHLPADHWCLKLQAWRVSLVFFFLNGEEKKNKVIHTVELPSLLAA